MELTPRKLVLVVVPLALLVAAGAQGWASLHARGRLRDFREAARAIGHGRGTSLPTDDAIRAQVEALAAARAITLADLRVSSHEESGLGTAAQYAPQLGQTLRGRMRVYEIRGSATTQALLFARTEPVEARVQLRAALEVIAPPRGGASPFGVRPGEADAPSERGVR